MVGHKGERAETIFIRIDREETGLHFLEHVVVAFVGSEMRTELDHLGQEQYDPFEFCGSNADLVASTATLFSCCTAPAVVINRQYRRDVNAHAAFFFDF